MFKTKWLALFVIAVAYLFSGCDSEPQHDWMLVTYPNPNRGEFTVLAVGTVPSEATLTIATMQGVILGREEVIGTGGPNRINHNFETDGSSFYIITLSSDDGLLEQVKTLKIN